MKAVWRPRTRQEQSRAEAKKSDHEGTEQSGNGAAPMEVDEGGIVTEEGSKESVLRDRAGSTDGTENTAAGKGQEGEVSAQELEATREKMREEMTKQMQEEVT